MAYKQNRGDLHEWIAKNETALLKYSPTDKTYKFIDHTIGFPALINVHDGDFHAVIKREGDNGVRICTDSEVVIHNE